MSLISRFLPRVLVVATVVSILDVFVIDRVFDIPVGSVRDWELWGIIYFIATYRFVYLPLRTEL